MDDSPGSGRPYKRVKYAQQDEEPIVTVPVSLGAGPWGRPSESLSVSPYPTPWSSQPSMASPSQILTLENDLQPYWSSPLSVTQSAPPDQQSTPATFVQPQAVSQQLSPPASRSPGLGSIVAGDTPSSTRQSNQIIHAPTHTIISPFTGGEDRLIKNTGPRYRRPDNGLVNGYVKFHWPGRNKSSPRPSISGPSSSNDPASDDVVEEVISDTTLPVARAHGSVVPNTAYIGTAPVGPNGTAFVLPPATPIAEDLWGLGPSNQSYGVVAMSNMLTPPQDSSSQPPSSGSPAKVPPHFGLQAKMDVMDRRLWDFYIRNWCPGRSVLSKTNLWLKDFAQMHDNVGICAAIQSLAGVYIYDYLPDERIRRRINERYVLAGNYFSRLLESPENYEVGKGKEAITMAVILSMQDIILTERRLKKPHAPRWLEGFKQGEYLLHKTDPGVRFWRDNHIQCDGLRISQSIIVGRAVILAQPMMELPDPETLQPEQEASRFGWLLYGTPDEMYEIHGGCGFSRKLLYTISQVTYCAARIRQDPESTIIPITARYLFRELSDMRQRSTEMRPKMDEDEDQEQAVRSTEPQVIDSVRTRPERYLIHSPEEMTDVTAESWRIAILIYLQCRVLRLPRNHPEVIANMSDLAKCISIMPTSGSSFTAQAPLLPVFFLGLLAYDPYHKSVSETWFQRVVRTPVRSSVPPLYLALQRIWRWIDKEIKPPSSPTNLNRVIGQREPWWEILVDQIQDKEEETLCLT